MLTHNQYRIFEIAKKHRLGHLGSCLSTLPILERIYKTRGPDDPVILSNGHAGLALFVCLERYLGKDAEVLYLKHGIHPGRDMENGIYCTTGSLRCGITIAVGFAMDRKRQVYCIFSDGEAGSGQVWSALNYIDEERLTNLHVHANLNASSTYKIIDSLMLGAKIKACCPAVHLHFNHIDRLDIPFLKGMNSHYHLITDDNWKWIEENKPSA